MAKAVTLFLIVVLALAMFGKLRMPARLKGRGAARKCDRCGRHRIGKGPCDCTRGKG